MGVIICNRAWNSDTGELGCEEACADAAGFTEAGEIGGEAVGDVHHGGWDAAASESLREGNGNSRVEMGLKEFS